MDAQLMAEFESCKLINCLCLNVLRLEFETSGAPRRGTPKKRARELLDLIVAVDADSQSTTVKKAA